ncbi:uncharacterized protein LOC122315184 isoform X1 [Carya illinoinensis]|uniref:NHL repeat-containing protein 2 n=1 Tax=Carya illinoinensis TaxID=32201 RepID=A0A8T1RJU5_CARIL|nr:uncharacterized protein LOC122315184 isoform X1 [Carya illinoinensis]XP_042986917.1 uncharacterized protein LOC122315184 isoform X1 [Carya illinoinensis]XP_042986926.1 uncharacterized protein LOC122315184 isoform X1 [Carya illinoinensis]KAG6667580.1 hypothetical protein CIPAW_01G110500 [Carya illinoinensis]
MKPLQLFLSSTWNNLKQRPCLYPYQFCRGPQWCAGGFYQQSRKVMDLSGLTVIPLPNSSRRIDKKIVETDCHAKRLLSGYQPITEVSHKCNPESDFLSFINSTLDEIEGPYHCWLNTFRENKDSFKRGATFLVLAGQFLDDSINGSNSSWMLEQAKSIQQRFPQLHIMGFQCGSSVFSSVDRSHVVQLIMNEYITFPILLSNKMFPEVANVPCYILFKDSRSHVFYHEKGQDIGILNKAVEELGIEKDKSRLVHNMKSTWSRHAEVAKEPYLCSFSQNLLLYFPGCISADESGNRLFLSDTNHHRIIVFNGNGKILDCIGSSPGFEDGEFETAKLVRPAASFYHAVEDCLYFVDSENHAIRRADLGSRILETLYPASNNDKKGIFSWTWIMDMLGLGRSVDIKSEEFDANSLMFPWHLMKSIDDSFLIINRSFDTLWIMDMASGKIKEVVKGFTNILETGGQWIMKKISILEQMPCDALQAQVDTSCTPEGLPYAGLISSFTTLQNQLVICDTVGQRILKIDRESGVFSNIQFSNFGILGLPYWLASPLERVYTIGGLWGAQIDHLQCFSLLPGRIEMQLNVDIPVDTKLVEPLQEGCVWRWARGAAAEVSVIEVEARSSEKVGVAQQWYDELDNLTFLTLEPELTVEDNNTAMDSKFQDERVHINCAVNTSPGTSEVIICAALYLKLRKPDLGDEDQEKYAARILDILNPDRTGKAERDSFIRILLKSDRDLRDLIFIKPLHVRIKLDILNHPKVENSKEIVLTDSSIEVNVSLNS